MNKKSLTLSIVIPVHNEENYIGQCLETIAQQTHPPDEVIIVDNGSNDGTVDVASNFRFVKVVTEKQSGITYARNTGFNAAKGDIIGRIDADTLLRNDWVEKVKSYFLDNKNIAAVTGKCYFYDFPFKRLVHILHFITVYFLQGIIAGTTILWGSNMAMRRSTWLAVRDHCDKTDTGHEDIDLALNLKRLGSQIRYFRQLVGDVSMRRGDITLVSATRYLARWHRTYFNNKMYFRALFIVFLELATLLVSVIAAPVSFYKKNFKSKR